jgi:hypothetical protein
MKLKKQTWRGDALFSLLLSGGLLWIFTLMNGASFFFDEWDFLLRRGLNANDLLRPHNGHFSLIPVSIFILLRRAFGLTSYVPYQIVGLLVHAAVCIGVYVIIRKRSQVLALCAGIIVCLLGSGWQNILWPFQIGMMGSFAAGLWALYEIDRDEINRARLSVLIGISLACAGGGIAVTGVVGVLLVLRREWRVLTALVPTIALYALWYLKYGVAQSQDGNMGKTPQFIVDSALAAGAAAGSKSLIFGGFVIGVVVVLLVLKQKELTLSSVPNGVVLFLIVTWALTGLSRAHLGEPGASRYVYVGATCLVLLFALLVPVARNVTMGLGLFVITICLVAPNMKMMRAGANGLLDTSVHLRAELSAFEHVRNSAGAEYTIDSARAPQLNTGEYLSAIDRYGSPAYSWRKVSSLQSATLIDVNRTLAEASHFLQLSPDAQCISSSSVAKEEIDIKPQSSVTVTIKAPKTLKFNWFKESPDAAYAIEISTSGTYVLQNLIEKESNVLNVSGDMQSVTICKQS